MQTHRDLIRSPFIPWSYGSEPLRCRLTRLTASSEYCDYEVVSGLIGTQKRDAGHSRLRSGVRKRALESKRKPLVMGPWSHANDSRPYSVTAAQLGGCPVAGSAQEVVYIGGGGL